MLRLQMLGGLVAAVAVGVFGCSPEDTVLQPQGAAPGAVADAGDDTPDPPSPGMTDDPAPDDPAPDEPTPDDVDAACDFRGVWAVRQTTFNQESVLSTVQTASNWYYFELDQSGTTLDVVEHMDCGIQVTGTGLADVTTTLQPAAITGMLRVNTQVGRAATVTNTGGRCEFTFERFWSIRGGEEALLDGRNDPSSVQELEERKPLPTQDATAGATDPDGDSVDGLRFDVAGLGNRNAIQRDWTEWFTNDDYPVMAGADHSTFEIRASFDNQENLLAVDPDSPLLRAGSRPMDKNHRVKFVYLGPSVESPEVQGFLGATDTDTCVAIQQLIPHEKVQD